MFEKFKTNIVNANLKTRLAITGAVSSLGVLGGQLVSADSTTDTVTAAVNSGVTSGLSDLKAGASSILSTNAGAIMGLVALSVVGFGAIKYGKKLLGKAF